MTRALGTESSVYMGRVDRVVFGKTLQCISKVETFLVHDAVQRV